VIARPAADDEAAVESGFVVAVVGHVLVVVVAEGAATVAGVGIAASEAAVPSAASVLG
jgi:hypothetical protein